MEKKQTKTDAHLHLSRINFLPINADILEDKADLKKILQNFSGICQEKECKFVSKTVEIHIQELQ